MERMEHPGAMPVPPAAISRLLSRFSREQIAAFTEIAIDLMDFADGDPDLEDATDLEDDFALTAEADGYGERGPGCAVSEEDACAWVEWHTMRGSQKRGPNILAGHEDVEDDDPGGGNDEDQGEADDEREPEHDHFMSYGTNQDAPISDRNPVML